MVRKLALLIGVSEYEAGLPPVRTAAGDVQAMQRVLQNPQLGGFEVAKILLNPPLEKMLVDIHNLFANSQKDDLVLLFFSGHGIVDESGKLYLATRSTNKETFKATAIAASHIQDIMRDSPSRKQVVILDCCYSGAFAQNWQPKRNCDTALLASSNSTQKSYEAEESGIYTRYLVEGIEQGVADKDSDGEVLIAELHKYAKQKVQAIRPQMKPDIQTYREGFQIAIAKSSIIKPHSPTVPIQQAQNWKCVYTLTDHTDTVNCLTISPDGQTLVSGSADQTIKIWSLNPGRHLHTLEGHSGTVNCVAISPDGQTLVTGSADQTIKIWNLNTRKHRNLGWFSAHLSSICALAITPDGQTLISGSQDHTIKLWNLAKGKQINHLTQQSWGVYSLAVTPDGRAIASDTLDHKIKLCSLITEEVWQNFTGHADWIWAIAISPDGKILASGSQDKTIKLWNLRTGELLYTLNDHFQAVHSVSFSPDGRTLASGSYDHTIKLWHVETGKIITTLKGHTNAVNSVVFSPDGETLASTSDDKTIKIWQA